MVTQVEVIEFLSQFAYQPALVYTFVILILTASSFGLPIPEEFTLISVGILAYIGLNPQAHPPPVEGAVPLHPWTAALVCFFAVFLSDFLVYWIGRVGGDRLRRSRRLARYVSGNVFTKVESLILRHGFWMPGVFRFTPGLRFPGHLACGIMRLPAWKFTLVDGTAALLTVPTQVLLVAYYGEVILAYFQQFKVVLLSMFGIGILLFLFRNHPWLQGLLALVAKKFGSEKDSP